METAINVGSDALTAGNTLAAQGEYNQALAAYESGLAIEPRAVPLLRQRCSVLLAMGRMAEAVESYDQLLRIDPNDVTALLGKGDALTAQRDAGARAFYEKAQALNPGDVTTLRRKAVAFRKLGLHEEALQAFRQAVSIDPQDAISLRGLGDQLLEMEAYEEAFAAFTEAAALASGVMSGAEWSTRGEALLRAQKTKPALELFRIATRLDPSFVPAWSGLARAQNQSKQVYDALATLDHILITHPENLTVLTEKGALLIQERRFEEAVATYDAILRVDPVNWSGWANKGVALHNLTQYEGAVSCYEKALELDPHNGEIWPYKGVCLEELGRLPEALICYDKTLEIDPKSFVALNNKGWLLAQQDSFEAALDLLNRAIEQNPVEQTSWLNKAVTLRRMDRIDDALACAKEGLAQVDDKRRLLNLTGMLLSDYKDDDESALAVYRQVDELDPSSLDNQACLAEVLIKLGRHKEGRQLAEQVAEAAEEALLRSIARFFVFCSFVFEDNREARTTSFDRFLRAFQEVPATTASTGRIWVFKGLCRSIRRSTLPMDLQFLLFSLIDMQSGTIKTEQFSFLQTQA